jgi:hypothetical protein
MTGRPASLLRQDVYSFAWQYVVKLVPEASAGRAG